MSRENTQEMLARVEGYCDKKFAFLRERFESNFKSGLETGASIAVTVEGETVVDLWGGYIDERRVTPWQRETIVNLQSASKGLAAVCVHMLIDRGLLDLNRPVAQDWPEFASGGKGKLPLRYILDHRAGLPYTTKLLPTDAAYVPGMVAAALAEQAPLWPPGEVAGYHALTQGFLEAELVQRVTCRSLGRFLREEVSSPLGIDVQIGLRSAELGHCADIIFPRDSQRRQTPADPQSPRARIGSILRPDETYNSEQFRRAEIPSTNGHGNARGLARLYGVLAMGGSLNGINLLSATAIKQMSEEQHDWEDAIFHRRYHQASGVILNSPPIAFMGASPRAFGHHASGGSLGFADPDSRLGFAYCINQTQSGVIIGKRRDALVETALACVP